MIEWMLEIGKVQNWVLLGLALGSIIGLIASLNAAECWLKRYFNI